MSRRLLSREKAAVGGQENPMRQKGPSVPVCREATETRRTKPGKQGFQVPAVDCAKKAKAQQQPMPGSSALFSRTRLSSLSVAQGLRGGHVWVEICSEDCLWEKKQFSFSLQSLSFTPLQMRRALLTGTI